MSAAAEDPEDAAPGRTDEEPAAPGRAARHGTDPERTTRERTTAEHRTAEHRTAGRTTAGHESAGRTTAGHRADDDVRRRRRWRLLGTAVMVLGGLLALGLLWSELAAADLGRALTSASPLWFVVVLGASALTFVGAATTVRAVSPVEVRPLPTLAVQVAGTFVNLLGPAGLGGMALNARYLSRRGAGAASAVAAVVAVQATSLAVTVAVVLGVVLASGRTAEGVRLLPGAATLVTAGVLLALVATVLLVRPLRRWVALRVREPLRAAASALRRLARSPERLVVAVLGSATVTGGFLLALDASLRAYGTSVPLVELVVVLFAGTAVGSVFPTPGGVGAVEAAITGGLVAVGVPAEAALLSAVTYRVATLWLWVAPGWVLTLLLRRADHL